MIILENLVIREEYLQEGKKQALAILGPIADLTFPNSPYRKPVINILMDADPTPSHKYVTVFAKMLKNSFDSVKEFMEIYKKNKPVNEISDDLSDSIQDYVNILTGEELYDLITQAEEKGFRGDISGINDIYDLEQILKATATKITRSSVKKGIQGLTEGKDFSIIFENDKVVGLMPFNWEASKIIASNYVGGCEGKWCIAYQKQDNYWEDIVVEQGKAPVYVIPIGNTEYKYAFMFSKDEGLDIWDDQDNKLTRSDMSNLINSLDITSEMLNEIRNKAIKTAKQNISNWGIDHTPVITFYSFGEITSNNSVFMGSVSVEKEFPYNDNDDNEILFGSYVEAELIEGKEFFNSKEGITLCKEIFESEEDIENYPNILDDCLIIDYGTDISFSEINEEASGYHYDNDDIDMDITLDKTYNTLVFMSTSRNNYSDEPIKETVFSGSRDNVYEYDYNGESTTYTIYTRAMDNLIDALPNYPKINSTFKNEWVQDEETEKKFGQGFFQFDQE